MDIDEAWDAFQKSRSIKKTSIAEKLDTIAAQLNEIQTDSARTAELVPKILGDDAAIEASNAEMPGMDPSMMGMGGAPSMDGAVPGAEDMSPDGMDLGADEGMIEDTETPPMEEEVPEAPVEGDVPETGEPEPVEDMGSDLPMDDLGSGAEDVLPEESTTEDIGAGANGTMDALINMLHEKVDEGNMADVKALADAIDQLGGSAGDLGVTENYVPELGQPPIPMDTVGTESTFKSADGAGAAPVDSSVTVPTQASEDDSNESLVEKVLEILNEAQVEIAETLEGDAPEEESSDEPEGTLEIEVEAEPEEQAEEESSEENSPEADLSEDGEAPFTECDCEHSEKSVGDLSFREIYAARQNGHDLISEYVQKSAGETNGYNEFDPWGLTRRSDMFAKADGAMSTGDNGASKATMADDVSLGTAPIKESATVADEVQKPQEKMSGKHDGTDSDTVADDLKEPMDHMKGNASGGEPLDDVDEKKGASDHSVGGGEPLDDVDEKKGTSDHEVGDSDLLDDIDEEKNASEGSAKGGDLLDDVDELKKSSADAGIQIMSLREMMAFKKAGMSGSSRPDCIATVGGELERPELGNLKKSSDSEPVRMGRGVDPHKVVEADWAEYNLYKARFGL